MRVKLFKSEKSNEILEFIKEYISICIFIPTILGGIWQTVALGSMSISFIRFFSIAQLLSDGIIIIICLGIWILEFYLLKKIFESDQKKNASSETLLNIINKNLKSRFVGILGLVLSSMSCIYCLRVTLLALSYKLDFTFLILIPIIFLVIMMVVISVWFILIILTKAKYEDLKKTSFIFRAGVFLFVVGGLIMFYIIGNVFYKFNSSFALPQNFENEENLICMLTKEDRNYIYKIHYMNDLYLFIDVFQKGDTVNTVGIKVLKSEVLFSAPSCKVVPYSQKILRDHDSLMKLTKDRIIYDSLRSPQFSEKLDSINGIVKSKDNN